MRPPETVERPESGAVATRSPRPTSDYRLRGLDLDAPALAESPQPARKARRSRRQRRRLCIQWFVIVAVTATVATVLRGSVIRSFSVSSASMVPTLQVGTDILVMKPGRLAGPVKAGNIIVFRQPAGFSCGSNGDYSRHLVGRVIGLPGETIWSAKKRIYVNGHRLDERGWYNPPFGELGGTAILRTTIPAGSYFVLGDNRTDTCDSRLLGPISKALLVGKAVATISRSGHLFVHHV